MKIKELETRLSKFPELGVLVMEVKIAYGKCHGCKEMKNAERIGKEF